MQISPLTQRFWSKVDRAPDGCWIWTGGQLHHGYGSAWHEGRFWQAHRLSYTVHVGPIGDDVVIDHLCRNTSCVRPDHLEPVTQRTNVLRGDSPSAVNARKQACNEGHLFSEHGHTNKRGHRVCRPCTQARQRRWLAARTQA